MTLLIPSLQEMEKAARAFLTATNQAKGVFALYGEMGAGKTTFIKALCEAMGVQDIVNSPTFAIINEYSKPSGEPVYHFDFYRLKHPGEAFDLGCEDYFASGHTCFIEWPEKIGSYLPDTCIRVNISLLPDGARLIEFNASNS
ncbi:MAG: tRNA threonylcarbamoyladenosine biosynthesis protein TsaE [Bacteroidetes bacterium ADurb.Bin416]|nr:MAG: tRNA threonylcarbamoyladenosine biosynthesis protein TsaE [Bacteroidetes bacterium ADurb.Bin416]